MGYGNLAYELPRQYEMPSTQAKPQVNKVKSARRSHSKKKLQGAYVRSVCTVVMVAASAGFMISQFVTVNETQQQIASLQKELTTLESTTSQMVFDLEQSVDLNQIEKIATTRLGMQRPEKYQTIYVNVKQDSVTETTAGEVEGVGNRVMSVLKKIGGNIVQFFSIK